MKRELTFEIQKRGRSYVAYMKEIPITENSELSHKRR
jgi:hypothetical protein